MQHYLWRAVDHEGEVLESFATKARDKAAALKFTRKLMGCHGCAKALTTDGLALLQGRHEGDRHRRSPGGGPLGQQPGGELTPAVSTTRTGHAAVQADEDAAAVRLGPLRPPNHFSQERHITSRDQFRERRLAALAEWRTLAA